MTDQTHIDIIRNKLNNTNFQTTDYFKDYLYKTIDNSPELRELVDEKVKKSIIEMSTYTFYNSSHFIEYLMKHINQDKYFDALIEKIIKNSDEVERNTIELLADKIADKISNDLCNNIKDDIAEKVKEALNI